MDITPKEFARRCALSGITLGVQEKGTAMRNISERNGYLNITYPVGPEETGSEHYRIVMTKPHDLLREYSDLTTDDGQVYGRGVAYRDPENPRKGGIALAWLKG